MAEVTRRRGSSSSLPSYSAGGLVVEPVKNAEIWARTQVVVELDQTLCGSSSHDTQYFDTGEILAGKVIIVPIFDIKASLVYIRLRLLEMVKRSSPTAYREFKRKPALSEMILNEELYPEDRVFRRGFKYTLPFSLVIPDYAPEKSCKCNKQNEGNGDGGGSFDMHLRLPPSLGYQSRYDTTFTTSIITLHPPKGSWKSPEVAGNFSSRASLSPGFNDKHTQVRTMHVSYSIVASIVSYNEVQPDLSMVAAEGNKTIEIRPSYEKFDDLSKIRGFDGKCLFQDEYTASTKIRRGFKSTGNVTVTKRGNQHLKIGTYGSVVELIDFDLEAVGDPPTVTNIEYKIHCDNITTKHPVSYFLSSQDMKEGTNNESVIIKHYRMNLSNPAWKMGPNGKSALKISIPVGLPDNLAPTFFSCLISRQYRISATVHFGRTTSASLTFPILIINPGTSPEYSTRPSSMVSQTVCQNEPQDPENISELSIPALTADLDASSASYMSTLALSSGISLNSESSTTFDPFVHDQDLLPPLPPPTQPKRAVPKPVRRLRNLTRVIE